MKLKFMLLALIAISFNSHASTRIEGKVHAVNSEDSTFTIRDPRTDQLHLIEFKAATKVLVNRREYSDLNVLKVGESVVYKNGNVKKELDFVDARVEEVDSENRRITYIDAQSGAIKTVPFTKAATNGWGSNALSVDELRPGQRVILEVVKR